MPMDGAEVVTLGESLVSLVASRPGPLAEVRSFEPVVAGAEANVAVGLARLAHRVAYIGRVGDDAFGSLIVRRLRGEGVDVRRLAVDPGHYTGMMVRELRDLGPAESIYHRAGSAGSRLSPADVQAAAELFDGARWLHLTGITPALSPTAAAAVEAAIELARTYGLTISLDLNIRRKLWSEGRAMEVLRGLAARVDVVLGGFDETALVAGLAATLEAAGAVDPGAGARALLELGPATVVVKLGSAGALQLGSDGASARHAGVAVPRPVDPVGAGDAFCAGYIAASLEGLPVEASLALGNACGATAVATVGDLTGLPGRAEAERLLAADGPDQLR